MRCAARLALLPLRALGRAMDLWTWSLDVLDILVTGHGEG